MSNYSAALTLIGKVIDDNLPSNPETFGIDEAIAEALAEAGLIAPDLPEPITQEGSPTWIKHPYGVSVEKDPCGNGYVISTPYAEWENPGGARKVALALLAAANAVEGKSA